MDTTVWSLAIRRRPGALGPRERAIVLTWGDLVRDNRAVIVGPVQLELLFGIADDAMFERVAEHLRNFDEEPLEPEDWELAARFGRSCARHGVAPALIDLVICAVAHRRDLEVFTLDGGFERYAKVVGVKLFQVPGS